MTEVELLERVVRELQGCSIPFMVVGSVASSYHGEPRLSYDIDIVVQGTEDQLLAFAARFGAPFYLSETAVREAAARRSMFNIIHPGCKYKVDIVVQKNREFDREELARRVPASIWGIDVDVASPEDTILSKLAWGKRGDSERQFNDAVMVAVAQWERLDRAYLETWAPVLRIGDELERALAAAEAERRRGRSSGE